MDLLIRSLSDSQPFLADPSWSILELKQHLHDRLPSLQLPPPAKQRLVQEGRVMADDGAAVGSVCRPGGALVVLARRDAAPPPRRQPEPPPTLADVNRAVREEAARSAAAGEPPPPPAPPPAPVAAGAGGVEGDAIRALVEGNFEQLRGYLEHLQEAIAQSGGEGAPNFEFVLPGLAEEGGEGGDSAGSEELDEYDEDEFEEEEEEEEDEEEDDAEEDEEDDDEEYEDDEGSSEGSGVESESGPGEAGAPGAAPAAAVANVDERALAELQAMGFSPALARSALLAARNRLPVAVELALAQGRRRGDPAAAPASVDTLVDMGFDRGQAQRALALSGNSMEAATHMLLLLGGVLGGGGGAAAAQAAGSEHPPARGSASASGIGSGSDYEVEGEESDEGIGAEGQAAPQLDSDEEGGREVGVAGGAGPEGAAALPEAPPADGAPGEQGA
jgi:hypothetical protein